MINSLKCMAATQLTHQLSFDGPNNVSYYRDDLYFDQSLPRLKGEDLIIDQCCCYNKIIITSIWYWWVVLKMNVHQVVFVKWDSKSRFKHNLNSFQCIDYRYGTSTFHVFSEQGIPGPKPLPFIGNLWGVWKQGI